MSLSTPTRVSVPFAVSGLKATIPASSNNTTGRAGYDQGFPPINMTAKTAGGIPPFGQDFNGILYDITLALRYMESGSGFVYDSAFSTAIGGYKVGAMIPRTDGAGFWLCTVDGTTVDPESAGSAAAGWMPVASAGAAAVTMTNANVTLTALQYGKPIIVITGTLTASVNLIFPNLVGQWTILNKTTGSFTITCKTSAGTGIGITGTASIFGDGTNIYASNSAVVAPTVPPGTIIDFAGVAEPSGYLACPTSPTNISRTSYPTLFAAIGTTWGVGDGSTTFGMPYFPANYAAVQSSGNVGSTTVGDVLAHTHGLPMGSGSSTSGVYVGRDDAPEGAAVSTNSSGGSANLAAGVRVMKCVKI